MRVLEHAWRMVKAHHREGLSPLHILAALSTRPDIESMLIRLGVLPSELRQHIDALVAQLPTLSVTPVLNAGARTLLAQAFAVAAEDGQRRITPTYLFAAIGHIEDPARDVLDAFGVDEHQLHQATQWLMIQDDLRHRVRSFMRSAANKPQGAIDRGYVAQLHS
jgi:ATP-dependent Clp protease ATP-binding subunit ClpA